MLKEAAVAYFNWLSQYLFNETEENHESLPAGLDSKPDPKF